MQHLWRCVMRCQSAGPATHNWTSRNLIATPCRTTFLAAFPHRNVATDAVYAVAAGRATGLFKEWHEVEPLVIGYSKAIHKRFNDRAAAQDWLEKCLASACPVGRDGSISKLDSPVTAVSRGRSTSTPTPWSSHSTPAAARLSSALARSSPARTEANAWHLGPSQASAGSLGSPTVAGKFSARHPVTRPAPLAPPSTASGTRPASSFSKDQAPEPNSTSASSTSASTGASTSAAPASGQRKSTGNDDGRVSANTGNTGGSKEGVSSVDGSAAAAVCSQAAVGPSSATPTPPARQSRRKQTVGSPANPGDAPSEAGSKPPTRRRKGGLSTKDAGHGTSPAVVDAALDPSSGRSPEEGVGESKAEAEALSRSGEGAQGGGAPVPAPKHFLEFDGGSRGNPGNGGFGAVLREGGRSGRVVHLVCGAALKPITNNQAEYMALLYGAKAAAAIGSKHLTTQGDSQLVTRQLTGQYKVNSQVLKPLYNQVKLQMDSFSSVTPTHVLRERNKIADALANVAMDAAEVASLASQVVSEASVPSEMKEETRQWAQLRLRGTMVHAKRLPTLISRIMQHSQHNRLISIQTHLMGSQAAQQLDTSRVFASVVVGEKVYGVDLGNVPAPDAVTGELPDSVAMPLYLHLLVRLLRQRWA